MSTKLLHSLKESSGHDSYICSSSLTHHPFPAVQLRIKLSYCKQRILPSLPGTGSCCWGNDHPKWRTLALLCLGVGQRIHTMCTHTHSLLPVCQEGHYQTPGERGSGLLEIVEIRGMLEVRGREERREKSERGPLFKHTLCIMWTSLGSIRQLRLRPDGLNLVYCQLYSRSTSGCLMTEDERLRSCTEIS